MDAGCFLLVHRPGKPAGGEIGIGKRHDRGNQSCVRLSINMITLGQLAIDPGRKSRDEVIVKGVHTTSFFVLTKNGRHATLFIVIGVRVACLHHLVSAKMGCCFLFQE